jgi:hypothetical protein
MSGEPAIGVPSSALISAVSPVDMAGILRQAGHPAAIVESGDFSRVQSSTRGIGFCVDFGGAADPERKHGEFSFRCWLHIRGDLPPRTIEEWNQSKRYARLFRQEQNLAMAMDVLLSGGVSEAHLRAQCELWERLLRELIVHMRKRRHRLVNPGAPRGRRRPEPPPVSHGTLVEVAPRNKRGGDDLARLAAAVLILFGLPGGLATAPADPPPEHPVCVDVRIGADRSAFFDCLNADLARTVEQQAGRQAALQAAVAGAQSSAPTQLGLFNTTATHEQLGTNFGHSAYPQRPVPVYHNPLLH